MLNVVDDPRECHDLLGLPEHAQMVEELKHLMMADMYGNDSDFIKDGELVGLPDKEFEVTPSYNLSAQRGWRL